MVKISANFDIIGQMFELFSCAVSVLGDWLWGLDILLMMVWHAFFNKLDH